MECSDGSLYTGIARDVAKRVELHNDGKGAKYTRGRGPVTIVAASEPLAKGAALSVELAVKKKKGREAKLKELRDRTRSVALKAKPVSAAKRAAGGAKARAARATETAKHDTRKRGATNQSTGVVTSPSKSATAESSRSR